MNTTIEQANEVKKLLLKENDRFRALGETPPFRSVTIVLGDKGYRLEVILGEEPYGHPAEIDGVPVVWDCD